MELQQSGISEPCSVGKETGTECHKISYTYLKRLNNIETLSDTDKELLSCRSGIKSDRLASVCEHHRIFYTKKYELYQTTCCDPLKKHKKTIYKSLRCVNKDFSMEIYDKLNLKIPQGQKICSSCRKCIQALPINTTDQESSEISDTASVCSIGDLDASSSKEAASKTISTTFDELGISPLKLHAVPAHSKLVYGKRKLKSACDSLRSKVCKVLGQGFPTEKNDNEQISKDIKQKAEDLDTLLSLIKEKVRMTQNTPEKIRLLTLVPISWSRQRIMEEFEVSEYAVRQSRHLLKEKGILSTPQSKRGKSLSLETVERVRNFYENDDYSRIMPGKKDVVSVARNVHKQKRLILSNLRELYAAFIFQFPESAVRFSKFCMLRPKWCVLPGSSGTHSVCVCSIHQNVKLLLHAVGEINESYHDLITYLVCSKENRDCMVRHCSHCPPSENLRRILQEKLNYDPSDEIEYSQWVSTDRTELIRCTASFEDYLNKLIEKLEKLIPHSYIAQAQSNYLKETKVNLKSDTAVVLLDFSENFSYVIQDEAQGYHWTSGACTLHTVVIHVRLPGSVDLSVCNLCVLSDDLDHDVAFVHATQKEIAKLICEKFSFVRKVCYFSDGCAGQYKNCKNFKNLCYHAKDFSLEASWSFFATSHGKSPCDGIGGTVKRLVTKESLGRCLDNQITTVDEVFKFCTSRIEHIHFRLVKKELIQQERHELSGRFTKVKTIPGTRGFHQFIPLSQDVVATKRISFDENYTSVFHFRESNRTLVTMSQLSVNSFISCVYDSHWFFGTIEKLNHEEDVVVKFLHPHGPARSFHWPSVDREDRCDVPLYNILSVVSVPVTKGSGRMWYFPEKEQFAEILFNKHFGS